ncbi:hypothetical protein [Alcanivorax sp.]|uniref:hypothetical protein n=1 Tax=Alcanivorax sp. TaxID=1872427 RepID=UPI0025C250DF|nr:hypothetical protein [Alcanivorax sp.]
MSDIEIPIENFRPPSLRTMARVTALQRRYFDATLEGAENVDPQRPGLFVGNLALMGVLDSPLFVYELYRQTGVFPRSLGDHFHFPTPVWGKLVTILAQYQLLRENYRQLMKLISMLVFSGRRPRKEVAKRRDEIPTGWQVHVEERTDTSCMAIEQGGSFYYSFASLEL